jgi:hypothetical protein
MRSLSHHRAGLPDGLFSNQKSQFGEILEGLAIGNLGLFYDRLVYLKAIGNILWPFGIFCGHFVYFPPILVFYTKQNLATLPQSSKCHSFDRMQFFCSP